MIKVDIICPGFIKFVGFFETMPEIGDVIDGGLYRIINRAVFEKPIIKGDPIVDYQAIIVLGNIIHKSFPNGEIA